MEFGKTFGMSKVFGNGNGIGVWNRMHVAGRTSEIEAVQ